MSFLSNFDSPTCKLHDPSIISVICSFGAQEQFVSMLKTVMLLNIFVNSEIHQVS